MNFKDTVIQLWSISKAALAGNEYPASRHDRLIYIKNEMLRSYPNLTKGLTAKELYLQITDLISYPN